MSETNNSALEERLIELFWEGLSDYSSDVWFDSSSKEKEELLWWALGKIGEPVDKDWALELFWMWADGIEEDAFVDFPSLAEEFKLYEGMWEGFSEQSLKEFVPTSARENVQATGKTLKEAVDPVAALQAKVLAGAPWYTEYFAVGPAVYEKASGDVFVPEDFDDWTDFEAAYSDTDNYDILPIVFGPHMNRTYTNEQFDTLEDALDNVIDNFYRDSDLGDINTHQGLFDNALMNKTVRDDATFVVAYAPDVQDAYGCFMRVSQKPLGSNKQLAKHYFKQMPKYVGPHMLAELLDTGLVGDAFSNEPNFAKSKYAWQAK